MRVAMLKADVLSRNDSNGHWQAKHCILNQRNPNDSASEPNERKTEHWTINGESETQKKKKKCDEEEKRERMSEVVRKKSRKNWQKVTTF